MSVLGNPLLITPEGYQISRSVRLRSSATGNFNRTFSTTGTSRQKFTLSAWVKRGALGAISQIMGCYDGTSTYSTNLYFLANDTLEFDYGGSSQYQLITTQVFRDPSAWYHIVVSCDSTQATAGSRVSMCVNGVQITSFSTANYPAQNANGQWMINTANNRIGSQWNGSSNYFDGYLTEVNFIDGQALTPSSFGETNPVTGVWQPKKYTGTYGTNGFFLNFSDPSAATAAAIGKDYSGNGNNWTPNNISVTAGVTYDSMLDVPTMWADGGNGRGNYCVVNPLKKPSTSTITDGNLNVTWTVTGGEQPASFAQSSGKWYWEQTQNGSVAAPGIILDTAVPSANSISQGYHYYGNGQFYTGTSGVAYGATFTTGDVIGVALDLDNLQITFYKNNVSQGAKSIAAGSYNPDLAAGSTITINANFGQRPFSYTPPTGFKALNTQNLPEPTIKKGNQFMDVNLWTGTGATQSIVNSGAMQPDLVWAKSRSSASYSHRLFDAVRGVNVDLQSNTTNGDTSEANSLTAFNSNGFSLGSDGVGGGVNTNAVTYVGWQWKESVTAGFDIVTYTGTGAARTIAHSLNAAPKMYIVKQRSGVSNWETYHTSLGSDYYVVLDGTNAKINSTVVWNNTAPTSTVFSLGTGGNNTSGQTYVAYLFAEVAGFSKFGSYTGNGSADGPFVYLGFRPRYVMVKCSSAVADWVIEDAARNASNLADLTLFPNLSAAEVQAGTYPQIDFLSNGFKIRSTSGYNNSNAATYIFAAFAENPFKNSLAR